MTDRNDRERERLRLKRQNPDYLAAQRARRAARMGKVRKIRKAMGYARITILRPERRGAQ